MTCVLVALDSSTSGQPVLSAAIALADLYDATVICLDVREQPFGAAAELARSAGVELRELNGPPIEVIARVDKPVAVVSPRHTGPNAPTGSSFPLTELMKGPRRLSSSSAMSPLRTTGSP